MENWRLEKDKSQYAKMETASTSFFDESVNRFKSTDPNDFWDEDVTRTRRLNDWQQKKSMPSLINVLSGDEGLDSLGLEAQIETSVPGSGSHTRVNSTGTVDNANSEEKQTALENRECFAEDVIRVWNQISQFIIHRMSEGYGVQIPGLCTITIQEEKILIPNTRYFQLRRTPLMILSRQLVHMYKLLNVDEFTYNYKAEAVPLNLTDISNKLQSPRRIIEGVVTEVLQAFARAVVCGKKVEFPFCNIGKLQVQNRTAKMKFYDEFCKKMGFDIPKPNLTAPKEFFLETSESATTAAQAAITSVLRDEDRYDGDDNSLPGHMTPLRKHIPSDTFRSVFHLREVRSVHDGELLVPMTMKRRGEGKDKKLKGSSPKAGGSDPARKKGSSIALDEEYETDYEGEEYPWTEPEPKPEPIQPPPKPREPTDQEIIDEFGLPNIPHPHDLHYGIVEEAKKKQRKTVFEAEQLYRRRTVTGKFDIDFINSSKPMFQEALYAHHNSLTSAILGVETVKKHYARREHLKDPPLSYDDTRFNPPSPQ